MSQSPELQKQIEVGNARIILADYIRKLMNSHNLTAWEAFSLAQEIIGSVLDDEKLPSVAIARENDERPSTDDY